MIIEKKFNINGMHCSSCGYYIEDKFKNEKGVKSIAVNMLDNNCKLVYDDNITSIKGLNKKIEKAGYEIVADSDDMGDMHMDNEINQNNSNTIELDKKIGYFLIFLSFLMLAVDALIQLKVLSEMSEILFEFIHHLMPIFATYMVITQGRIYIKAVINFFKSGHANMDTLTGIGVTTAFIYSFVISAFEIPLSNILDTSRSFYDVVVILIGLIGLGKTIEMNAKKKTTEAIRKLVELSSKTTLIKINGEIIEKDISQVNLGDIAIVKQGMKIPVDGKVVLGVGNIDESSLSGESLAVQKEIGDLVFAGTILTDGYIEISVNGVGSDTKLGRITKMVENAMMSKAPIQKLADIISSYFTKIVIVIALLSLSLWIIYGIYTKDYNLSIRLAITSFVSILVVACPCALGLATPLAIGRGVGEAAKNGILFKNATSIQKIKDIDVIIFDKTGTITNGKFEIIKSEYPDESLEISEIENIVFSFESKSNHPIANIFIKKFANAKQLEIVELSISQNGMSGFINNNKYKIGNGKYLGVSIDPNEIGTHVYVSKNDKIIAKYVLMDEPKKGIDIILKSLRDMKIEVYLATGDKSEIGNQIGKQLGFKTDQIYTEMLPEDKLNLVKSFHKKGKTVAMFGDGINDSPALAIADVGIAMGDGSEIALETADVAILNGNLNKLPIMFELSKTTFRAINQNLFWAFSYNIIIIPIATGIFYLPFGILINPVFDAIAMSFSSLAVVFNSNRIRVK